MAGRSSPRYRVFNPKDYNCPISRIYNNIYSADSFQKEFLIPGEIGNGYCRRYIVNPSVEILISDMTFNESITMKAEKQKFYQYGLGFCLETPFLWSGADDKKDYEIDCGESYIFYGSNGNNLCTYHSGKRYYSIYIQYSPDNIMNMIQYLNNDYVNNGFIYGGSNFCGRRFSPDIKLILNDIINCRYSDNVKQIYLEGKALELMAVYLNEIIYENGKSYDDVKLSLTDIDALHYAKRILDNNIISAPTLRQLSKLVCLNEFKVKAGFKELFGKSVHAYVIDKRLELARFLMIDGKLSVTEAAVWVGYSNISHFADKFRKKYGVNPSEYIKRN